jgi:hypothetical protein
MLAVPAIVCATLAYRSRLSAICQGTVRDMPKLEKSTPILSKIRQIWRTCFYIDGCATVRTIALKWPIFEQKKGPATICLGLNYCSMGSSQPPSCETVPLNHVFKNTEFPPFWPIFFLKNLQATHSGTWQQ